MYLSITEKLVYQEEVRHQGRCGVRSDNFVNKEEIEKIDTYIMKFKFLLFLHDEEGMRRVNLATGTN